MRPEFIVVDGKLLLSSGWICSSSSLVIKVSFVSSNIYSFSNSAYYISCSCVSIIWVSRWVFFIDLIWWYGSSKRTEFTFGRVRDILSWGGPVLLDVSLFLFKYFGCDPCLWLFWWIFFYGCLFMYVQWYYEGKILQFSIMMHSKLFQSFFAKSAYNTVFFQVWDWWGTGSLKGYGLILLTSVSLLIMLTSVSVLVLLTSVYVMVILTGVLVYMCVTLIWSILMLEFIAKITVDNGLNHLMGWSHVYR